MSEQTLAVIGSVLVPVLGLVGWIVKSHITTKNEQIAQLKQERDDLAGEKDLQEHTSEAKLARAEADYQKLLVAHAEAGKELSQLKATIKSLQARQDDARKKYREAAEVARKYYEAGKRQKALLADAEQRLNELTAQLESHLTTQAEKEKAQQRAAGYSKKVKQLRAQLNGVIGQDGRVWHKSVPADAPHFVPLADRKMPIISVLNLKGGVGKTTITANLAGYLGRTVGKRVLMIDVDHQRSLSQTVLSNADRQSASVAGRTVQHFLASPARDGNALAAATETVPNMKNCWVVTNIDPDPAYGIAQSLDDLEMHLMGEWLVNPESPDVRFLMRQALHSEAVRARFDFVLFDCPPRLTTACINALTASDFLLIPVQAEAVSIRSVQHLLMRLKDLREVGALADLRVLGMVANMMSSKAADRSTHETKLLEQTAAAAERTWGEPVRVFQTKLTREVRYAEATRELSDGRELKLAIGYPSIHRQYQELMSELEGHIHESRGVAGVSS
jgi:cellulose biosynthesis protein BcsQ